MEYAQAVKELKETGRWIAQRQLTWGSAGNISVRLDETHLLVTGSGTRFDSLTDEDFCLYDMESGTWTGKKPSRETPVHLACYSLPGCGAVLHASPFYTTLAASSNLTVPNDLFVENMYELQRLVRIPYAHPGSADLTRLVGEAAPESHVLLMANHGVILHDASLEGCRSMLEILEYSCRMALEAQSANLTLHHLPPETVKDFLYRSGYKKSRYPENT